MSPKILFLRLKSLHSCFEDSSGKEHRNGEFLKCHAEPRKPTRRQSVYCMRYILINGPKTCLIKMKPLSNTDVQRWPGEKARREAGNRTQVKSSICADAPGRLTHLPFQALSLPSSSRAHKPCQNSTDLRFSEVGNQTTRNDGGNDDLKLQWIQSRTNRFLQERLFRGR